MLSRSAIRDRNRVIYGVMRLIALSAVLALASGAVAQDTSWVITNAKIEVGNGQVINDTSLVIDQGRIVAIGGDLTKFSFPKIDGTGLVVYPGFIDAFTRSGLKLPDQPATPVAPAFPSTISGMFWHGNRRGVFADLDAEKLLDPASFSKDYYSNGVTTIHAASARGSFGGWSVITDLVADGLKVGQVMQTLSFAGGGGGFGGGGGGGAGATAPAYPTSLMGRIAVMRQVLWDAKNPGDDSVLKALSPAVQGAKPALFSANTERECFRAFRLSRETGLRPVLLGGREAWRSLEDLAGTDVVVSLDPGFEPTVDPTAASETPLEVRQDRRAAWLAEANYVDRLAKGKVRFAFSADREADKLLELVRKHIGWGLDRNTALRALTIDAASILGIQDKVGTIEVGKRANLAIMTGDFADPKTVVKFVIIGGKRIEVSPK